MKHSSQEETTTRVNVSTFVIGFIEYFLHFHKLRKNVTDCGGVLYLYFKCCGAIRCEYRFYNVGFLLSCSHLKHTAPLCCVQSQKHQPTAECLCRIHNTSRFFCISISHAWFFNVHTFKVPVLLTSRKDNIAINKPIMQKDTKIRVSFLFLFGLP